MQLSVVVITLNEEKNIRRCLESVQGIADELIVLDSCSTDKTCEIAVSCGARIVEQEFLGYVGQRNFSSKIAKHDWILMLDADEVLSSALRERIIQLKNRQSFDAYYLNRLTNYCGKWIRHCGWYPDRKIRLYDRNKGSWQGHLVHEYWQADNDARIGKIGGDLLHYSFNTIDEHISQIHKFTELSAKADAANGKNCSLLKIWLGPKWFFFSRFILKLGFLDGYYGYLVCKYSAYGQFIKYTKTRAYSKQQKH